MALADVCGFDIRSGKSKLSLGFSDGFGGPSAIDAIAASQSFTVPQGIDVRRITMLELAHFAQSSYGRTATTRSSTSSSRLVDLLLFTRCSPVVFLFVTV